MGNKLIENKMSWMTSKDLVNDWHPLWTPLSEIKDTIGTIQIPTGGGKSGEIIRDAYMHILNTLNSNINKKLVIVFGAPILKLNRQLLGDFFCVIEKQIPDAKRVMKFYLNSSDDGNLYDFVGEMGINVNKFDEHSIDAFRDSQFKVAVVSSCYPSLPEFATYENISKINSFAKCVAYLDEAHTIVDCRTRDEHSLEEYNEEDRNKYHAVEILCGAGYVYAVSATPNGNITELLNKKAGYNKRDLRTHCLIDVKPQELIERNIIVPPLVQRKGTSNDSLTANDCVEFMQLVQRSDTIVGYGDKKRPPHKILVTVDSRKHLVELCKELRDFGYVVISTCSGNEEGWGCRKWVPNNEDSIPLSDRYEENTYGETVAEDAFIKTIEEESSDCFVLHVQQLRQGIDVKSLTDAIIFNKATHPNDGYKKCLYQTVGRVVRTASGERGVPIEQRTKKNANVFFVLGDEDYEYLSGRMASVLLDYYGDGNVEFSNPVYGENGNVGQKRFDPFSFGDDEFSHERIRDIEMMKVDVLEYLNSHMLTYIEINEIPKAEASMIIRDAIESRCSNYLADGRDCTVGELIGKANLWKTVNEIYDSFKGTLDEEYN